jgi:hypothetical protein
VYENNKYLLGCTIRGLFWKLSCVWIGGWGIGCFLGCFSAIVGIFSIEKLKKRTRWKQFSGGITIVYIRLIFPRSFPRLPCRFFLIIGISWTGWSLSISSILDNSSWLKGNGNGIFFFFEWIANLVVQQILVKQWKEHPVALPIVTEHHHLNNLY